MKFDEELKVSGEAIQLNSMGSQFSGSNLRLADVWRNFQNFQILSGCSDEKIGLDWRRTRSQDAQLPYNRPIAIEGI